MPRSICLRQVGECCNINTNRQRSCPLNSNAIVHFRAGLWRSSRSNRTVVVDFGVGIVLAADQSPKFLAMFQTHLKFFVRVFLKDKFFSILNILGLALGITVSIILLLILQHDLTYDKHYKNHERIYRLSGHLQATGVDIRVARSARELGDVLKNEFPEVMAVTRANSWDHVLVRYERDGDDIAFYEEDVVRTDSTISMYLTITSSQVIRTRLLIR